MSRVVTRLCVVCGARTALGSLAEPAFCYDHRGMAVPSVPFPGSLEPVEGVHYFREELRTFAVHFEVVLHAQGTDDEDEDDVARRAWTGTDLARLDSEVLHVEVVGRAGERLVDVDGRPFDRDAWMAAQLPGARVVRRVERPLDAAP